MRQRLKHLGGRGMLYGVIALFTSLAAFPFYYMLITSFKQNKDLYVGATHAAHNPLIFNDPMTLRHWDYLFRHTLYLQWLWNTFFVGAVVVVITLVVAVPAAYSLARLAGRWGEKLGIGIFLTYLIPPTLLFIPLNRLVTILGLHDSLWSLILIYPTFTIPFCTWLLMGFFKSIPHDIEEQAMIDGYSRLGAIIKAVLPLSLPGLLTVIIFAFTLVMQEFVYALTFISSVSKMTISIGVPVALVRGDTFYWGSLLGACLLASVPIAILYNFFLDRFIAGFLGGAVKG